MLTKQHKNIIIDILVSKKAEILNYDRDEDWADETLEAIDRFLMNDWILDSYQERQDENMNIQLDDISHLGEQDYLDSDTHLGQVE